MEKPTRDPVVINDHLLALHYLKHRATRLRKGWPPMVYLEEVEIVLEMLQVGLFQDWYRTMVSTLPGFPEPANPKPETP